MGERIVELEEKLKHAEENCINKTCVVFKDKEDCVAKLLELEKENAELTDYNKKLLQSDIDKQNKIVLLSHKVNDLQKENAELDCQKNRNKACYSCANATERCFTNEIGCPCEKYKSYKDENAELKAIVRNTKAVDESFALQTIQLTNAKELLRDVLPYIDLTDCVNSDPRLVLYDKIKSLIKEIKEK